MWGKRSRKPLGGWEAIPHFRSGSAAKHKSASDWVPKIPAMLMAIVIIYLIVSGQLGLWRLVSLWHLRGDLQDEQLALSAQVVDLDTRRRLLETDTLYIEQIARTEYHLSHPDEIIYDLRPSEPYR